MTAHHRIAPSSLARLIQCAGSLMAQEAAPDFSDDADAIEGEAAHEVSCKMALCGTVKAGDLTSNGTVVTEEMIDGAVEYCNHIFRITNNRGHRIQRFHEQAIALPHLHPTCFGTPDAYYLDAEHGICDLIEYKFGRRYVDAFENWQNLAYCSGIPGYHTYRIHIVQPRCYTGEGICRTWEVSAEDLWGIYVPRMQAAIQAALSLMPPTATGEGCRNCHARYGCKTLWEQASWMEQYAKGAMLTIMTPEAAGFELTLLKRAEDVLKARISGIEAYVDSYISQGRKVPGWMVEFGQGRERFEHDAETVAVMGDAFGVNLRKPAETMTPAQARAALKKAGVDASFIDAMVRRPQGERKIKKVDINRARKVFSRMPATSLNNDSE